VELSKAMALEVDVGCMTLGINGRQAVSDLGFGIDFFSTTGNWQRYTGPDYLRGVLANTTDVIRQVYRPFFNESSLDSNGFIYLTNRTAITLSDAANIAPFRPPFNNNVIYDSNAVYIIGNCTQDLQSQLGIPPPMNGQSSMCGLLTMSGSFSEAGQSYRGQSRMVCATATQVNMVNATIVVDVGNKISLNLTRLHSDLNYLRADYWGVVDGGNDITFRLHDPYVRFTLAENPTSPTTHFITQYEAFLDNSFGPGSGGNAFGMIGDMMLGAPAVLDANLNVNYAALPLLDEGFDDVDIGNTSTVRTTQWSGQVGASFIFGSVGYNGWAARTSSPIQVLGTGGKTGSCYKPYYAFGFAPLVFSATVMIIWALIMFVKTSLFGTKPLHRAYGGLQPYVDVMCPGASVKDTLLIWEKAPEPKLQVVSKGDVALDSGTDSETALGFLKAE
jgi:hypothetical protein